MTTPVYICTGFLDSGKTTFIKDTLMKQEWIEEGPTLLLQCEDCLLYTSPSPRD